MGKNGDAQDLCTFIADMDGGHIFTEQDVD